MCMVCLSATFHKHTDTLLRKRRGRVCVCVCVCACECDRRIAKCCPLGSFPWLASKMFGLVAGWREKKNKKTKQAGPGWLLTEYTYEIHTKCLFDCFCVGLTDVKSTGYCRERAQAVRKTIHTYKNTHTHTHTHTHTYRTKRVLALCYWGAHKHLYKDINYCRFMTLNIHLNLKLNKEDARQGGNQNINLKGERAWLERQSAGVLIELWLESVSCAYDHPWSLIQAMIFWGGGSGSKVSPTVKKQTKGSGERRRRGEAALLSKAWWELGEVEF